MELSSWRGRGRTRNQSFFWTVNLKKRTIYKASLSFNYILFASFCISITEAVPSRHVNGDKLHHYSRQLSASALPAESQTLPPEEFLEPSTVTNSKLGPVSEDDTGYVVIAKQISYQPAYEPSVNPFLSHIEQGSKVKPVRHRNQKKKLEKDLNLKNFKHKEKTIGEHLKHRTGVKTNPNFKEEDGTQLPVDPNKPHFVDSNEAWDTFGEESRAFGDEEKDLREYFNVLFSNDYST